MQRITATAVVLGALIVAVSLIYHGRQLASVAGQMEALEQRTGDLDTRLKEFSQQLPSLIEQAGRDAGRQAVHGVIDEAFHKPLGKAFTQFTHTTSNVSAQAGNPFDVRGLLPGGGMPLIRFDIPEPVVNIEILTQVRDLPSLPWLTSTGNPPAVVRTNHNLQTPHIPTTGEDGR